MGKERKFATVANDERRWVRPPISGAYSQWENRLMGITQFWRQTMSIAQFWRQTKPCGHFCLSLRRSNTVANRLEKIVSHHRPNFLPSFGGLSCASEIKQPMIVQLVFTGALWSIPIRGTFYSVIPNLCYVGVLIRNVISHIVLVTGSSSSPESVQQGKSTVPSFCKCKPRKYTVPVNYILLFLVIAC